MDQSDGVKPLGPSLFGAPQTCMAFPPGIPSGCRGGELRKVPLQLWRPLWKKPRAFFMAKANSPRKGLCWSLTADGRSDFPHPGLPVPPKREEFISSGNGASRPWTGNSVARDGSRKRQQTAVPLKNWCVKVNSKTQAPQKVRFNQKIIECDLSLFLTSYPHTNRTPF